MAETLTPEQLQEANIAVGLMRKLMGGTRRTDFLKMVKAEIPTAPIPEIDAPKPFEAALAKQQETIDALQAKIDGREKESKTAGVLLKLQRDRGYLDDGLADIFKIMQEKKIDDPEIAADHFDAIQRKNAPAPITPSSYFGGGGRAFNPAADDDTKKWFADPEGMFEEAVGTIIEESRSGRLAA